MLQYKEGIYTINTKLPKAFLMVYNNEKKRNDEWNIHEKYINDKIKVIVITTESKEIFISSLKHMKIQNTNMK